jgi:threonine/homoserine/homoserine lactone efflux protein
VDSRSLGLYVAASLALIVTPGQDMMYVVSRSLAQGRLAGACSALGVSLGILVHTALAALGVGALLHALPSLFLVLRIAGALYLVWLGTRMLLAAPHLAVRAGSRVPLLTVVREGVLSNVSNPKIVLFFVAFLPQFVDPASTHATRDLVLLGALYAALALPVKAAVGIAAGAFSERLARSSSAIAWMNRIGGTVLVALGLRLAAGGR